MANLTFKDKVYLLTRRIPRGFVATYGQLAALAGSPRASRAVGLALKTNPDAPNTPCHRVVSVDGSLTGYSAGQGLITKQAMLTREGVIFQGNKVDLDSCLWQPDYQSNT